MAQGSCRFSPDPEEVGTGHHVIHGRMAIHITIVLLSQSCKTIAYSRKVITNMDLYSDQYKI